jgi:hypothetical protein
MARTRGAKYRVGSPEISKLDRQMAACSVAGLAIANKKRGMSHVWALKMGHD